MTRKSSRNDEYLYPYQELTKIAETLDRLTKNGNTKGGPPWRRDSNYKMKIDLPSYNGHMNIETFLDCVKSIGSFLFIYLIIT